MSNVRRRPSLWSYFSFQRPHQRSSSISSQLRPSDPHEKLGRHQESGSSIGFPAMMSSRMIKTVTIGVVFCLALFLLAPRSLPESKPRGGGGAGAGGGGGGQVALDPSSGTTKCTKSSSPHKPLVQYVLMVDAGSTGSRIHVYRFNNCGETPELEDEAFKMIQPGLSSFKEKAEDAAKSLDELLDLAMETVPDKLKGCSPVAVKATAGLRLLGAEKSQKILDAVRNRLETKYPFPVVPGSGIEIMEGKDEGVYAWITTNYLLGKIGTIEDTPTAAIFDLGGGSTQIVFEPTFPSIGGGMPAHLAPGDHKYELKFGGRNFDLYQHSHLGYGLKEARKSIHQIVAQAKIDELGKSWADKPIVNPCIIPGMTREVEIEVNKETEEIVKVNMTGPAEPSMPQCRFLAEQILKKDEKCELTPCSFNGIHQPPLERTFATEDVYIFSYFYDRSHPLGLPDSFTLKEMYETTAKVCSGEKAWDVFNSIPGAMKELRGRPEHCLDLSFMLALLHTGYEMPLDREVKMAKKIKGNELGWCLGASLPLLDQGSGGWQCKIREVS